MERLWTPWRYNYITGGTDPAAEAKEKRAGVPEELSAWPGEDLGCVFCNLIAAVEWSIAAGNDIAEAERAGLIIARLPKTFVCLNAFPYTSGHLLVVPYRHTDSLAKLIGDEAEELIRAAQRMEMALRAVYRPDGVNLGMNLGEAAGAGVRDHLHLHELPRWFGDTNFMTVTAETRVLPETLRNTWKRLRDQMRKNEGISESMQQSV